VNQVVFSSSHVEDCINVIRTSLVLFVAPHLIWYHIHVIIVIPLSTLIVCDISYSIKCNLLAIDYESIDSMHKENILGIHR